MGRIVKLYAKLENTTLFIFNINMFVRYTVLCTSRLSYTAPKTEEGWPKCVKTCWRKLPPVPSETGLAQQYIRPNKVPAGNYGRYNCKDPSQGMGPYIGSDVKEKGGPYPIYTFVYKNSYWTFLNLEMLYMFIIIVL